AQNSMAAVSADGSTVRVLILRLNSSCNRSIEGEQAFSCLLEAVGEGAMLELQCGPLSEFQDLAPRGGGESSGSAAPVSSLNLAIRWSWNSGSVASLAGCPCRR